MNKKLITLLAGIGIFSSIEAGVPEESAEIETIPDSRISKSLHFESAKVTGYLGNPEPIIILDKDKQEESSFVINRSFKDELRINIDKETISRLGGN